VVIDAEETKNSLFGGLKSSTPKAEKKQQTSEVAKLDTCKLKTVEHQQLPQVQTPALPKWKTLEKVTVLLTNQQRDAIEDLARAIMRNRSQSNPSKDDRERITANTVVRALIDNLIETISELQIKEIQNEDELKLWLQQLFIAQGQPNGNKDKNNL
jgi:hypothetical protein